MNEPQNIKLSAGNQTQKTTYFCTSQNHYVKKDQHFLGLVVMGGTQLQRGTGKFFRGMELFCGGG